MLFLNPDKNGTPDVSPPTEEPSVATTVETREAVSTSFPRLFTWLVAPEVIWQRLHHLGRSLSEAITRKTLTREIVATPKHLSANPLTKVAAVVVSGLAIGAIVRLIHQTRPTKQLSEVAE